jgi:hypothetical protein
VMNLECLDLSETLRRETRWFSDMSQHHKSSETCRL